VDQKRRDDHTSYEEQFLADAGGGTATTNPPTNPDPTKPPSGVTEPRKVGGGTSEAALRQNLPQHIANYATGTYDQRQETIAEVRKYGKPVIAALIGALKEEDPARANAAYDMLKEFTKQDFGRLPGEPGDRAPFIQKWTDWWKGRRRAFPCDGGGPGRPSTRLRLAQAAAGRTGRDRSRRFLSPA